MDLAPYIDHLRRELTVAAGARGEEAHALTVRLTAALEPAVRLALLEAVSTAADEITRDLAPGCVEVRLVGRDVGFVVTPPLHHDGGAYAEEEESDERSPAGRFERPEGGVPPPIVRPGWPEGDATPMAARPGSPEGDEGGTARISLRVPEHLKPRLDEAAAREGLSVNAWLVRAVAATLDGGEPGRRGDRRSGQRSDQGPGQRPDQRFEPRSSQRFGRRPGRRFGGPSRSQPGGGCHRGWVR
ncbi:toxin-antitoxin system HicB family antitoxin [Actinomadura luzonensis]|uniref:toxin-antitoxin system HicB family antitoxin n=1 Tax=Actinomadura luzonensis TaxID=2805427 RepID=UPI0027E3857B|nr:toxin-antitoxin system HicB family antitoxin [Actinomadura luzonensis]